ncbi:hypothetical protein BT63DRAFT_451594 [Microthyrium microscopicum]|uniref:Uncharacterized protein n=1 Tax=Microthyrium microscopicum TaxID=703497 RepID=A0A6A6UMP3_9PEZI|nr:hypothetical protein BT63DRAFT_451594 [Microthyrium microscopicum]
MHFTTALILAAAATVSAIDLAVQGKTSISGNFSVAGGETGLIAVINRCDYPVYLKSIDGGKGRPEPPLSTLAPAGISQNNMYQERLKELGGGDGTSIKISRDPDSSHWSHGILQIEYSVKNGRVWFDGSNINCHGTECPFYDSGVMLKGAGGQFGSTCTEAMCRPHTCDTGAHWYMKDDDNLAVKDCPQTAGLSVVLCAKDASLKMVKRVKGSV